MLAATLAVETNLDTEEQVIAEVLGAQHEVNSITVIRDDDALSIYTAVKWPEDRREKSAVRTHLGDAEREVMRRIGKQVQQAGQNLDFNIVDYRSESIEGVEPPPRVIFKKTLG